ncbi:MAG: hypothetical protein ABR511_04245 [Acidimicrobiales bacterium]
MADTHVAHEASPPSAGDAGCGCCQPPGPAPVHEELRRLEARQAELDRRSAAAGSRS